MKQQAGPPTCNSRYTQICDVIGKFLIRGTSSFPKLETVTMHHIRATVVDKGLYGFINFSEWYGWSGVAVDNSCASDNTSATVPATAPHSWI